MTGRPDYWNQSNFDGLRAIAETFADDPALGEFARYCALRENGLRRQAFDALGRFIDVAASWGAAEQRTFAEWVVRLQAALPHVVELIPEPLKRWLVEVLRTWSDETEEGAPQRWLGVLTGDVAAFWEALRRDAGDDLARGRLVRHLTGLLDYATHHLPRGFIGDPQGVLVETEAQELLAGFRDASARELVEGSYRAARQKVLDWMDYRASGTPASFDEWCSRMRGYRWSEIMVEYYAKK
jgi:hypothetical protein